MKFAVFLFLLFFTLTTSKELPTRSYLVTGLDTVQSIELPSEVLDHKKTYIFEWESDTEKSILYLQGAQSSKLRRVRASSNLARIVTNHYSQSRVPVRITRKISDPKIENFEEQLRLATKYEKIPRLYKVNAQIIRQIPIMWKYINNTDSFILHDEFEVTIYYSSSTHADIIERAEIFARYIVNFEEKVNNVETKVFELLDVKQFGQKVINIGSSLSKNKNKVDNSRKDEELEILNRDMLKTMNHCYTTKQHVYEIINLITPTDSTPAFVNSERVNGDFMQHIRRITNNASKLFMYWGETDIKPPQHITTVSSSGLYAIVDFENNEFFVYSGKLVSYKFLRMVCAMVEVFLGNIQDMRVTFITGGYLLPPPFILYFRDELQEHTKLKSSVKVKKY